MNYYSKMAAICCLEVIDEKLKKQVDRIQRDKIFVCKRRIDKFVTCEREKVVDFKRKNLKRERDGRKDSSS